MTVLAENPYINLNMPQSVLPMHEADPRTSEQSRLVENLNKSISDTLSELREAQVMALNSRFVPLDQQLNALLKLDEGWDGYDAPTPMTETVAEARWVLEKLHESLVAPQRISASADGGVAFSFRASGDRRAQIELLNSGEKFAHLYDLNGNSCTLDWPQNLDQEPFDRLLEPILKYMQP